MWRTRDLLSSYKAFVSEVAAEAFHAGEIRLSEDLAVKKIHSFWLHFDALLDHDSRRRFHTRAVALDWQEDLHQKRRALLTEKDYLHVQRQKAERYLMTFPLQRRGEGYEFIHKSMFEYGVVLRIVQLSQKSLPVAILSGSCELLLSFP